MKIKLAIIEKDVDYLNKIASALSYKYSDRIEAYLFSDSTLAEETVRNVNVVLVYEGYEIGQMSQFPKCSFAYLTDRPGVDTIDGYPVVFKYQKLEDFYKQILNLYSENAQGVVSKKNETGNTANVIAFMSPCGGVGTSTLAAACAMHFAAKGKRTLYLNLETFGKASTYFIGQGQFCMSDIIMALKSRKANLQLKLESCVRQDSCGVFFFSETDIALDQMELENEEVLRLLTELKLSGQYDQIIIDIDFALERDIVRLYSQMNSVIWVSDGSDVAKAKFERAIECIETIDKIDKQADIDEILLLYNKNFGAEAQDASKKNFRVIGAAPRYQDAPSRQVAMALASSPVFDKI